MPNVALMVLDTLRKDTFDDEFEWLPGLRFERAYSTANWTVPAHASLFTGRYSSEVGVHSKNMTFDTPLTSMPERLQEAGYTTRAFSANPNVTGHFDFDRGFDDFQTPERLAHHNDDNLFDWWEFSKSTDRAGWRKYLYGAREVILSDVDTLRSLAHGTRLKLGPDSPAEYGGATDALELVHEVSFGSDEFLFCNLMEVHEPYRAPPEYQHVEEPPLTETIGTVTLGDVDGRQVRQAYHDCAAYLSDIYAELFEELRRSFDYVITLSDHGELLGEHDSWGHEYGLYPELVQIPLVISGDGLSGTVSTPVSLLDVYSTVLSLAGVGDDDSRGDSLLDDDPGGERLTEYHGLTPWSVRKLEENGYDPGIDRYDVEKHGYAGPLDYYGYQSTDGYQETGTSSFDEPRRRMEELLADLDVRTVHGGSEVPQAVKEQLENLGYG